MSASTFRAVLIDHDGPARLACLELDGRAEQFGPSAAALLALGFVLDCQSPQDLRALSERLGHGGRLRIATTRGTVVRSGGLVAITTPDVDERVAVPRCIALLDAWAATIERATRPVLASAWATNPSPAVKASRSEVIEVRLTRSELAVFLLSDGTVTTESARALSDYRLYPPDGGAGRNALLRDLLDHEGLPGAPTPARIEQLRGYAEAGVIPGAIADPVLAAGRVDDRQWQTITQLAGLGPSRVNTVPRWLLTAIHDDRTVPVPGYDALHDGIDPREQLATAIGTLVANGWSLEGSGDAVFDPDRREPLEFRFTRPRGRPRLSWE